MPDNFSWNPRLLILNIIEFDLLNILTKFTFSFDFTMYSLTNGHGLWLSFYNQSPSTTYYPGYQQSYNGYTLFLDVVFNIIYIQLTFYD